MEQTEDTISHRKRLRMFRASVLRVYAASIRRKADNTEQVDEIASAWGLSRSGVLSEMARAQNEIEECARRAAREDQ